ncbi:MAG: DMT family transporter [Acidimicrobiales bacterium]
MTFALLAGMALAVLSTVFNNSGMVVEKLAIRRMPELHARRTVEMATTLFRAPLWILGFALLILGSGTQVLALTDAPISIVQAVAACGIVLLLVLSHFVLGDRLGRHEYAGMAMVLVALVLLGLSVDRHTDKVTTTGSFGALVAVAVPALLVSTGFFLAAERVQGASVRRARLRAPLFGVSSGLLYGVAGLGVKEVSTIVQQHGLIAGIPHIMTSPAVYIVVALSAVGFLMFQTALQRCAASILVPVNNVTGSAFFIVLGGYIFHEPLPDAAAPLVFRLLAFAMIIVGLVTLALGKEMVETRDFRIGEHIDSARSDHGHDRRVDELPSDGSAVVHT